MGFDLRRDSRIARARTDAAVLVPGKRTATEQLARSSTRSARVVPETRQTADDYRFTVSLPAAARDAIRSAFRAYNASGTAPALPELRREVIVRAFKIAIPTTDTQLVEGLMTSDSWYIDETDDRFFASLFETTLPRRGPKAVCPEPRSFLVVTMSEASLADLRKKAGTWGKPIPSPHPTPTPDSAQQERVQREDATVSSAFGWVWGMLQGDSTCRP